MQYANPVSRAKPDVRVSPAKPAFFDDINCRANTGLCCRQRQRFPRYGNKQVACQMSFLMSCWQIFWPT